MRDPLARVEKVAMKLPATAAANSAVLSLLAELVAAVLAQTAQSAELVAEVRGLRRDLAASAPRAVMPIAACDIELLRAIAATSEGRKFTVSELLETISDRAEDRRLRNAIVAALGGVNGRSLGKLLRRVEGSDIEQLRVVRVGEGRDGIAWRIAGSAGLKPAVTVAAPASK